MKTFIVTGIVYSVILAVVSNESWKAGWKDSRKTKTCTCLFDYKTLERENDRLRTVLYSRVSQFVLLEN